jgi:acetyl esterase
VALDSYTAGVLRLMSAAYPDVGGSITEAAEARRRYAAARFPSGPRVGDVTDRVVPGDPAVPVRIYRPDGARTPLPVVVYYHGGGFVLCGLDSHDGICRRLAECSSVIVVSVDYRLAPEHKFPAAADDAYAALRWASEQAPQFGGDPSRVAVAGDSAGGALAAATCLRARAVGSPAISFQLLIYPVTDALAERRDVPDSMLTTRQMRWFTEQYLARPQDAGHPYVSPLRAPSLAGLPPAFVLTAEHDPLRVEGEAFAERLASFGVPVTRTRITGLFHGLFGLGALVPVARRAEQAVCAALRAALRTEPTPTTDGAANARVMTLAKGMSVHG